MTEQTTPLPWRNLRLVPGDTKGGSAGSVAPGTEPVPPAEPGGATALPVSPGTSAVSPLSAADRTGLAARHWQAAVANGAGQLWLKPDRVGHVLLNGRPETMAEHWAYMRSREWVPEDLRGEGWGKFLAGAGVLYHVAIAAPVKATARMVDAAAERPLRLSILAAVVLVLVFAVLPHIHL